MRVTSPTSQAAVLKYVAMPRAHPMKLRAGSLVAYVAPLKTIPDASALARTLRPGRTAMWCDSARFHPVTGRWSLLGLDPWLTLTAQGDRLQLRTSAATRTWLGDPIDAWQQLLCRYRLDRRSALRAGPVRRALGLMGFFSYEMNRWIERLPAPKPGTGTN